MLVCQRNAQGGGGDGEGEGEVFTCRTQLYRPSVPVKLAFVVSLVLRQYSTVIANPNLCIKYKAVMYIMERSFFLSVLELDLQ